MQGQQQGPGGRWAPGTLQNPLTCTLCPARTFTAALFNPASVYKVAPSVKTLAFITLALNALLILDTIPKCQKPLDLMRSITGPALLLQSLGNIISFLIIILFYITLTFL